MCHRYGISDRSAACLLNAALVDYGIITEHNKAELTDRSKIQRQRDKWGKEEVVESSLQNRRDRLAGFYYDGREDKTLQKVGKKLTFAKELHEIVVTESGHRYVDHVSPNSGSAADIAKELLDVIWDNDAHPVVLGSDGIAVNTGRNSGVNRRIELGVGRPLQQAICGIHINELTLRHVFKDADGGTSGPASFHGPVGKAFQRDLTTLPLAKFEPSLVPSIPVEVRNEMSKDQQYLHDMCRAVQAGPEGVTQCLLALEPGAIHQARWVTLANRVLRLYLSTEAPAPALVRLVHFILNQYGPGWFRYRLHSNISDGVKNLFFLISLSRKLPERDRNITQKVLQRNGFWAHSEHVLIAMLADDQQENRMLAVERIRRCRTRRCQDQDPDGIRQFVIPDISFHAEEYHHMIDWQDTTEPPLVMEMSDETIAAVVEAPMDFSDFPCHSQGVERWVKEVTQTAEKKAGHSGRHALILAKARSRTDLPVMDTRRDFYDWLRVTSDR